MKPMTRKQKANYASKKNSPKGKGVFTYMKKYENGRKQAQEVTSQRQRTGLAGESTDTLAAL